MPKLKAGKIKPFSKKRDKAYGKKEIIPASSVIGILIKAAVEKARNEKKENAKSDEEKPYKIIKEHLPENIGGYGTVSKGYGAAPHTSYTNYGKLFSYLGQFKSKNAYENTSNPFGALNKSTESSSFTLADRESMDKIGRFDKYMRSPVMDMPVMALSLVPIAGLSSGEWEEIKMFMKFDPVMYTLKTKTA